MSYPCGNSGDAGGGGVDGSEGGEDQEDSSSSSVSFPSLIEHVEESVNNLNVNADTEKINTTESVEDALSNFRQQWQKELESPQRQSVSNQLNTSGGNSRSDSIESDEEKAKVLFLKGVEHEQTGKLYEAIQYYKRAVQLIPDIEFRLYESSKMGKSKKDESPQHIPVSHETRLNNINSELCQIEDDFDDGDLLCRVERIISKDGRFCQPEHEQRQTHISCLPVELVLYILRWVVSNDLDLVSLEKCSAVCRGLYLCARDQEIWRLICIRTWGINCGTPKSNDFLNWRQMLIERPRLRYNGCYISKTTYIRHGENSFQDQFYRPWYLIEYFRYLRFFPDGMVLMLTTADEPSLCCGHLKQRYSQTNKGVLSGHYRLHNDKVVIVVKKPPLRDSNKMQSSNTRFRSRRKDNLHDNLGQTFHLELQIQTHRSRRFCTLSWCGYRVFIKNNNGTESSSNFEIVKSKFPSFWFSRVKSYHAESDSLLQ